MDDLTWLLPAEGTAEQWERNAHGWEGERPRGQEYRCYFCTHLKTADVLFCGSCTWIKAFKGAAHPLSAKKKITTYFSNTATFTVYPSLGVTPL